MVLYRNEWIVTHLFAPTIIIEILYGTEDKNVRMLIIKWAETSCSENSLVDRTVNYNYLNKTIYNQYKTFDYFPIYYNRCYEIGTIKGMNSLPIELYRVDADSNGLISINSF